MARPVQNTNQNWTPTQAYVLAIICLVIGIGAGYFIGASRSSDSRRASQTATESFGTQSPMGSGQFQNQQSSPQELARIVDPMLQQLKANPLDFQLLTQVGNAYYDHGAFPKAIEYYSRALTVNPSNNDVRTDMGTSYFNSGDPDKAIEQFSIVLKSNPNHANALFNMGIVRLQGKKDAKGAIAAWEELLKKNPGYPRRQEVQDLIASAKSQ